jgi:PAS domain S-box-containing protein
MNSAVTQTEIEGLFEILGSNLPVGVCVIQDEKFCYVNCDFSVYTGYREDELLGKNFLTIVVPEDRETAR